MELCRYLFARFKAAGVRHVFGIPVPAIPVFAALVDVSGQA